MDQTEAWRLLCSGIALLAFGWICTELIGLPHWLVGTAGVVIGLLLGVHGVNVSKRNRLT